MSPAKKTAAPNNIYTAMLAMATIVMIATFAFVAYKCYSDYDTVFKVMDAAR